MIERAVRAVELHTPSVVVHREDDVIVAPGAVGDGLVAAAGEEESREE